MSSHEDFELLGELELQLEMVPMVWRKYQGLNFPRAQKVKIILSLKERVFNVMLALPSHNDFCAVMLTRASTRSLKICVPQLNMCDKQKCNIINSTAFLVEKSTSVLPATICQNTG